VWAKSAGGVGYRLHWQWSQASGSDSVASFLLTEGDEDVAVVSLRRKADRPFTESEVEGIKESISHLGLALKMSRLATRSVAAHVVDSVHSGRRSFLQPARRKWQLAAAACLALTAWMVFGTLDYRVVVPCTLLAESRQHISAPFDGVLVAQAAIAGQQVASGQVLCRLDDRELLLQKRQLEAQFNTLEKQKDEALALEERAKVQVLGAQQEEVRAQMELVDWQLERAAVRAPVDAVVLSGDLRERVGSPVKAGEALFEIAPPGKVFVELAIPEGEIDEVSQGLRGEFASNALPEQMHGFEVSLVRPMAEIRDERTVFVCEATLTEAGPWLRPGMEGMARVSVGPRPVWWVTFHQMIDFIRMKAWF
jgi:multidrug efflux pump subunit AcrA (membrane-fusion protein)